MSARGKLAVGDTVTCPCNPKCIGSWDVDGAIEIAGQRPDKSYIYKPARSRGPCIDGTIVRFQRGIEGTEVLVKQKHGAFRFYVPIGYGQYASRDVSELVWTLERGLVKT